MENDHSVEQVSRSTSPTRPNSTTSGTTPATEIHSDTNSVASAETASVATAFVVPGPPYNTPTTQSVADGTTSPNLAGARDALAVLTGAITLGSSELSNASSNPVDAVTADGTTAGATVIVDSNGKEVDEGKAHLRVPVRSDVPLMKQLFKAPPKLEKKARRAWKRAKKLVGADSASRATTPTQKTNTSDITPPNEHVHEHSKWEEVAREDLIRALGRAGQYAEDCRKTDDSRSKGDYYSELVADVIGKGELTFDASYLE